MQRPGPEHVTRHTNSTEAVSHITVYNAFLPTIRLAMYTYSVDQ